MKKLALIAFMFLSPAMAYAESPDILEQGNNAPFPGARGPGYSNFTFYQWDFHESKMRQTDGSQAVTLLEDQATGRQYIVVYIPGQAPAITPRLDTEYIPGCQIQQGFQCSTYPGDGSSSNRLQTIKEAKLKDALKTIKNAILEALGFNRSPA